jgi:zinc D-Ala-D-Ala carboxypeptidase
MRLSENFDLAELQVSQTAARRGLSNVAPMEIVPNLRRLVDLILQPLRDALGRPIVVTSGYRSPAVNAAVGGAANSAHMRGLAADIIVPGMSVRDVCREVVRLGLPFDQVIAEFGEWCHVAVAPGGREPRREQLTATRQGGVTVYSKGIA